ncbi:MAG: hypothetical protein HY904_04425 [Deltaproteobacteria bacterium]|nr:hypothetical protein [Deltaproteobacteria bacterium]
MIVACENCHSRIRIVDPEPQAPQVTVRCTVCQHTFVVTKAAAAEAPQFGAPGTFPGAATSPFAAPAPFGAPGSRPGAPASPFAAPAPFGTPGSYSSAAPAPFGAPAAYPAAGPFGAAGGWAPPATPPPVAPMAFPAPLTDPFAVPRGAMPAPLGPPAPTGPTSGPFAQAARALTERSMPVAGPAWGGAPDPLGVIPNGVPRPPPSAPPGPSPAGPVPAVFMAPQAVPPPPTPPPAPAALDPLADYAPPGFAQSGAAFVMPAGFEPAPTPPPAPAQPAAAMDAQDLFDMMPAEPTQSGARPLFDVEAGAPAERATQVTDMSGALAAQEAAPGPAAAAPTTPLRSARPATAKPAVPGRARGIALTVAGLLALGAGAAAAFTVPIGGRTLAASVGDAVGAGAAELQPGDLHTTTWSTAGGGRVLIILGDVSNHGDQVSPAVLVKVEFRDAKGAPLRAEEGYAGKLIPEVDLAEMAEKGTLKARHRELSKRMAGRDLAPGTSWPFMVLFPDPPDSMQQLVVQVTAHRADPPGVATPVMPVKLEDPPPQPPKASPAPPQEEAPAPPAAAADDAPPPPPPPPERSPPRKRTKARRAAPSGE